jgi:hypothetical protein
MRLIKLSLNIFLTNDGYNQLFLGRGNQESLGLLLPANLAQLVNKGINRATRNIADFLKSEALITKSDDDEKFF